MPGKICTPLDLSPTGQIVHNSPLVRRSASRARRGLKILRMAPPNGGRLGIKARLGEVAERLKATVC